MKIAGRSRKGERTCENARMSRRSAITQSGTRFCKRFAIPRRLAPSEPAEIPAFSAKFSEKEVQKELVCIVNSGKLTCSEPRFSPVPNLIFLNSTVAEVTEISPQ